jgi:hypothetical protein
MKTQVQQPKGQETLQPKAARQASVNSIINGYGAAMQRQAVEEESLQGKFDTRQLKGVEEEEPLQGKFHGMQLKGIEEEEPLQGKFIPTQLKVEEEEITQHKSRNTSQPGIIQKKGVIQFDRYVTEGGIYPHIHVGDNFVVFSTNANSHTYLQQGDLVRYESIQNVIDNITSGAVEINVGRKSILSFLKRMKKGRGPGA